MDLTALLLSRIQFAFTVSFHIIFPSFTIGLAAWLGSYAILKNRIEQSRRLFWLTFLSFPLPFIATLTGWFTAEVGRQPWTIYGALRTADAMTPFLTTRAATISLIVFSAVYSFIFAFDGFDLGVGILFGLTRSVMRHRAMFSAVAPIWDGNETWLVVGDVVLWGAFRSLTRCYSQPFTRQSL
jgi:cytochrome bd-type quinol oxidase subunit 1